MEASLIADMQVQEDEDRGRKNELAAQHGNASEKFYQQSQPNAATTSQMQGGPD